MFYFTTLAEIFAIKILAYFTDSSLLKILAYSQLYRLLKEII